MSVRLRLGLLAPEFPPMLGGMAELARGLAAALREPGDEVRVFALASPRRPAGADVESPSLTGRPWVDGKALAKREGAVDAWLLMNAGLTPLVAGLRRPCFAYWHGNDFLNPWLACGPPWLEAIRRPYLAAIRHPLRRRAIARYAGGLRRVFTNSQGTRALIERSFSDIAGRIAVIPPGVDAAFFQERTPPPAGTPLRLLTVSRLSKHTRRKNVDGVLDALALLRDRLPFRYRVVGDGDDRRRLEEHAAALGIAHLVEFRGSVDAQGLLAAYRDADLLVLASKATASDVEGFGMVYIEAAAAGVPSLCSRAGGAIDAVVDGETGLLIDDSSPAAIAAGLEEFAHRRALFDPDRLRAFADTFRWPKIAADLRRQLAERL